MNLHLQHVHVVTEVIVVVGGVDVVVAVTDVVVCDTDVVDIYVVDVVSPPVGTIINGWFIFSNARYSILSMSIDDSMVIPMVTLPLLFIVSSV